MALWRESLLARAVLRGETRGYRHHPQLDRFRAGGDSLALIDRYLAAVHAEATSRGYHFAADKFTSRRGRATLAVTRGQLNWEFGHLAAKLALRHPDRCAALLLVARARPHPLFHVTRGNVAPWERGG